ncbi:MAG: hypothetical protein AB8B71_09505 [Paracoccaceae bacterium]
MSSVRKTQIGLIAGLTLSGCASTLPGSDRAELGNISRSNIVPKSTPTALLVGFHDFCVNAPPTRAAKEDHLRSAAYVPTSPKTADLQVFLSDDARPAIAISDTMCLAQARSRTGQTQRVQDYVAKTFPDARALDVTKIDTELEQAWVTATPAIIATQRTNSINNTPDYAVIYFRDRANVSP